MILERGGIPVGTLALARTDVPYWGEQPPIAGYIHRFAVLRRWSGDGLGDRLLDWAAEEVRRWGRPKLRLDTLAGNPRLVGYYLDRGFRLVGRVRLRTFAGPRRLVLLEKELGPSERKSKTAARPRSKVR